jgi:hypothetical protein
MRRVDYRPSIERGLGNMMGINQFCRAVDEAELLPQSTMAMPAISALYLMPSSKTICRSETGGGGRRRGELVATLNIAHTYLR